MSASHNATAGDLHAGDPHADDLHKVLIAHGYFPLEDMPDRQPPLLTALQMRDLLHARVIDAGTTTRFAQMHGVSQHHVERVLTGACEPCPRLERALGVRSITLYETAPEKPRPTLDQLNPANPAIEAIGQQT